MRTKGLLTYFCKGIQSLAKRVFWMGGNRQHPNGSIVRNYSFAEIIGKSGIYFYDTIRVGLFVQAPWNDYPAHAHDSEEWLVLIVRKERLIHKNSVLLLCLIRFFMNKSLLYFIYF